MADTTKSSRKVESFFHKVNIPVPYESDYTSDDRYVTYGSNNQYPSFLLSLYAESPIHSAIINTKASYLIGDGMKDDNSKEINIQVNAQDSFNEFLMKCVKDYLIFNYFAVEVVYNSFFEPIEYHFVPAQNIRTNKSKTRFWYSEDWGRGGKLIQYERWIPDGTTANSKMFFFDGYNPSVQKVYSSPDYIGSIKSIMTDIAIRDFNLNNIKNHFSVSTLITFFMGSNVSDEVKQHTLDTINRSYTGESGQKIILDFQTSNGKSAEVQNISPGDWDKAYVEILKSVSDDIYRGHSVTSPMLFGVKTEGQLGGSTELETAYEIFKNTYVRVKRAELQSAFNLLFSGSTVVSSNLSFIDKPLFSAKINDTLKEKIYTINELRKEAGLPPLDNGNRLLSEQEETSVQSVNTADELEEEKKTWVKRELSDEDFEKVSGLGVNKDEFEFLSDGKIVFSATQADDFHLRFSTSEDVAKWLTENSIKNKPISDIVEELKESNIDISIADLKDTLKSLNEAGLLSSSVINDKVTVKPNKEANTSTGNGVLVMYDYVLRPGVKGGLIIDTSRGFCRKIVGNSKYYSRADIQTMSAVFGYDIFRYCGGFFHNSSSGETTPFCRHQWKSVIVKRKTN